jgi:hypothetical protein
MANLAEINALCKIAGKPNLAMDFFAAGKSPGEVREELLAVACSSVAEVNVAIPAKEGVGKQRSNNELDTNSIYKKWNAVKVRR